MSYINLNGKLVEDAGINPANRAFRYGHGLFETMLVRDGQICLAEYHWERLFAGAKVLYIDMPKLMTAEWLEQEVLKTVSKNKLEKLCRVRLQIYAGEGGILEAQHPKAGFVIECFALDEHITRFNETGLVVGIAGGIFKANDALANHKTTNALVYAIAAQQAREQKWNDALVCNTAGNIIESTIANIFWIKDGEVFTPPLSEGCIAGVMRRHIMQCMPVTEQALTIDILLQADNVFLTNAIRCIKWIRTISNTQYTIEGIKQVTAKMYC